VSDEGDGSPPVVETVVMVAGVAVTLVLFGYVGAHAVTGPENVPPSATVESANRTPDGVRVGVLFDAGGDAGLESATLSVDCGNSTETIQFRNVPANDRQRATVICPPGTNGPTARVVTYVEA
jgi:hypothetical protein